MLRRSALPGISTAAALALSCAAPTLRADFPTPTDNQAMTIPYAKAEESLSKMQLPPGFKATVFAAEPDVMQPIAMTWDQKGRLWIAENYTYSDSKERFDMKLRDRILIFEDKNNDGRYDERKIFWDEAQMLTSIERGYGGVYAMCPPHLLWIPDKDGDDVPDGPPQVLLDGFETKADSRHTFANGLKWGPDGWLYGRIGISSTSWIDVPGTPKENRLPTAGGIWRYHPVRKIYEPYCHGTTNPWGMDWDENGEMFFINTVIGHFWHGMRGAFLKRMHGEPPYEHVYGLIDQHADHYHWDTGKSWTDSRNASGNKHDELGGGHAHVGMMIYQGTNWPKEYRGKVFTLNLHGRRANVERIEKQGSGYVAKHEPDMFKTADPWFRGIEIQYGPDGGVYMLDWSDIGECHENDGVHRNSGRIYKITYGDAVKPKEADLTKLSDEELVKLQLSDNEWLVRMARWELRERAIKGGNLTATIKQLLAMHDGASDTRTKLRSVWTAGYIFDASSKEVMSATMADLKSHLDQWLASKDDALKSSAIHLVYTYNKKMAGAMPPNASEKDKANMEKYFEELADTAVTHIAASTPRQRLAWAETLSVWNDAQKLKLASALVAYGEDAKDHNLPLMYWFGIRDLPATDLVNLAKGCRIPLVTELIARRTAEDMETNPAALNTLLVFAKDQEGRNMLDTTDAILRGLTTGFTGWRKAQKPEAWDKFSARVASLKCDTFDQKLRDLNVLFGDGRALDEVKRIVKDGNADVNARMAALKTLIDAKDADLRKTCESLLDVRSLNTVAARGLAAFDDPAIGELLVKNYRKFYPAERPAVLDTLVSRPAFAAALLNALAAGRIERADVTAMQARQIRGFNDEALTKKLAEAWGEQRESSEDKKKLIADLKTRLTKDALAKADVNAGRLVFNNVCAACHTLYGQGNHIGPDLTGSGRHDLSYLLDNIVDPSAMVAADYRMTVMTLKDGRILSGNVAAKTQRTVTLKMVGQETTVERTEIAKQEEFPMSLMPEGLLLTLNEQQQRDLVAYLQTYAQVPLPAASAAK
ncbi:putative membrane-bound dehydrogenase-like protein [Roseimicrobium gellanilyticum]|uniref:Putative membrane-bound dehydrogenase-like protein n=1 Tax=Roseimicrobium gellanilyticum TaxID=748857 RepID=A0A366HVG7_9BACT|nr:PVC-type heme-binding CxxCH protein [Roseimicrobium gellanilyticum]RBP47554.1 putative membrane-bound dehydrogenase-like protein [Roseimicrobium gellanilyticum]